MPRFRAAILSFLVPLVGCSSGDFHIATGSPGDAAHPSDGDGAAAADGASDVDHGDALEDAALDTTPGEAGTCVLATCTAEPACFDRSCSTGACTYAANASKCDDGKACTTDTCVSACTASTTPPIKTCDAASSGCQHAMFDVDLDGYSPKDGCGPVDCNDASKLVFPGEPTFYGTGIDGTTTSTTTNFDYDCDGKAEQQLTTVAKCTKSVGGLCTLTPGWLPSGSGSPIPPCGADGDWVNGCVLGTTMLCNFDTSTDPGNPSSLTRVRQSCR